MINMPRTKYSKKKTPKITSQQPLLLTVITDKQEENFNDIKDFLKSNNNTPKLNTMNYHFENSFESSNDVITVVAKRGKHIVAFVTGKNLNENLSQNQFI
jgi:hypothetical protein